MDKLKFMGLNELTSCYDFHGMTTQEIFSKISQKINVIIEHFKYLENNTSSKITVLSEKVEYLVNQGVSEEVAKKITSMADDGTLSNIINDTLFTDITTMINVNVDNINKNSSEIINNKKLIESFKNLIDGNTSLINTTNEKINCIENTLNYTKYVDNYPTIQQAIDDTPHGGILNFDGNKEYLLDSYIIDKGITFNFNGAILKSNTTGNVFRCLSTGEHEPTQRFLNYHFVRNTIIPSNYFVIDGGINVVLDGTFSNCYATTSIINNYRGYGLIVKGEIRNSNAPKVIWLQQADNDAQYSYAIRIDCDITNASGTGIYIDGGNCTISGVVESCVIGIEYSGKKPLLPCNVSGVHFENNTNCSLKLLDNTGSQCNINLVSCAFIRHAHAILVGRRIFLTTQNCYFDGNGVEESSTGLSVTLTYRGINNAFFKRDTSQFDTSNCELNNDVFATCTNKVWL